MRHYTPEHSGQSVLGRTNRIFPKTWVRLEFPSGLNERFTEYGKLAAQLESPVEITTSPALFGEMLRGSVGMPLIQTSQSDLETSLNSKHAADLLDAHLIQTLSSIGRTQIDFYLLKLKRTLEEDQLSGILESLESARQEGHIGYLGLDVVNLGSALGNWQFHDAFDVVFIPEAIPSEDRDTLTRMAHQRRVGVVVRTERTSPNPNSEYTQIVKAKSAEDLRALLVSH